MKWFGKPKAIETIADERVTWQTVVNAGNRCEADIKLIEATSLLSPAEKETLKNDALDVFVDVFTSYVRR